jgi:Glycosyl hydrolase family 76
MIASPPQPKTLLTAVILTLAAAACCLAPPSPALLGAAAAATRRPAGASGYPAGASRPAFHVHRARLAGASATRATVVQIATTGHGHKRHRVLLRGNPARAWLSFQEMQQYYYVLGSGLYKGEPFSFLWPFSQALAATVTMADIPGVRPVLTRELKARFIGLRSYLDTNNAGAIEGTYTSSLAAFDGTAAPPTGPGGAKYYDDNDWIGIELVRMYRLTREPAVLSTAESIMAFEMAGWQSIPTLGCSGGLPFSNLAENNTRNTITTAPAAELAVQLYRVTRQSQYLQFAQMAYEWVRTCLLEPSYMYGDHVNRRGIIEPHLWSYTQGVMIGAGTLLYQATGNGTYLYEARQTAAGALAYFTPVRLAQEIPFFVSVYLRNLLYLDSVTHDPPGPSIAQAYVDYAWGHNRLPENLFVAGSPPSGQLLVQAAFVQIYALLSSSPQTYF